MNGNRTDVRIGTTNGGVVIGKNGKAVGVGGTINEHAPMAVRALVAAIRSQIARVPESDRALVASLLDKVDVEAAAPRPDRTKMLTMLQTVRNVAEGALGSLIASGIEDIF